VSTRECGGVAAVATIVFFAFLGVLALSLLTGW
jgi:hypothetical protein